MIIIHDKNIATETTETVQTSEGTTTQSSTHPVSAKTTVSGEFESSSPTRSMKGMSDFSQQSNIKKDKAFPSLRWRFT